MRFIGLVQFFAFVLFISNSAYAFIGHCPEHVISNNHLRSALEFIRPFAGSFKLGSCEIEIQICDLSSGENSTIENFVADMLVTDKTGFQRYIPIYFHKYKADSMSEIHLIYNRAFLYRFKDNNFDPNSGRNERWDVEFVKTSNLTTLKYIEIGYTSQTERKNHVNKKWIICGSEREEQVRNRSSQYHSNVWIELNL